MHCLNFKNIPEFLEILEPKRCGIFKRLCRQLAHLDTWYGLSVLKNS